MNNESLDWQTPPEWRVAQWLNTDTPLGLQALRGQVVMLHAFQMLCPGCVQHALPQAAAVHQALSAHGVVVIGLHSVFEHHAVMTVPALQVFMHEYRIRYPVAVDAPGIGDDTLPLTMRDYGLQGTPSLLLFDRQGRLRVHEFGQVHDLVLGLHLGQLLAEPPVHGQGAEPDAHRAGLGDATGQR